mgnify:FL=1
MDIFDFSEENSKQLFLAAVILSAQVLEKHLDAPNLKSKLAGLSEEKWSWELLNTLQEFGFKAKWKKYKEEVQLTELPMPCIIQQDNKFLVLLRHNTEEILAFDMNEKKPVKLLVKDSQASWNKQVFLIATKIKLTELPTHFGLGWFLPAFWQFKRFFYEVLASSCLLQIFMLITPLFTQVIIDKVLVHKGLSTLDVLMMGLIFIAIFQMLLGYLRTYIFSTLTNKVDVILGSKLYSHIVSLPIRYFESRRVGETVARVKELENIRQFVSGSSLVLIIDTAFCFIFILAMFWYSKLLCLVALLMIPFMVLLNVIVTPIYRKRIEEKFEAGAESQSFLVESITGAATVKTLALEQHFIRRWNDLLGHYVKTSFNVVNTANMANSIGGFLQQLSTFLILWVGARLVMANELSVGQLVAFQMLSGQVSGPILRLVGVWQQFQQVRISIDRIGDIMNLTSEGAGRSEQSAFRQGALYFDKVSFRYNVDEPQVVKNISLKIAPGMTVGIVGPSGSGKSTFAKLLQGLYDPEEGRIMVDNVDISTYTPSAYRRQIGTVLQENFLFCGTVRENIGIAKPGASDEEIRLAAELSGAHEFIMKMKKGYDTIIGERGDSLSGGQRQKLAISRALLLNPKILILDEATSALDALSEREVMSHVQKLRGSRTILMIAHRLSTVRNTDVILVMREGKIVEYGNHDDLVQKNGLYAQMYREQEGMSHA